MFDIEPFQGWLFLYQNELDSNSPFAEIDHNSLYFDRFIYEFPVHPDWDEIDSENLLIKILFVSYEDKYAIIELLGDWNDLQQNDFRLLSDNCLRLLLEEGVNKFILIAENIFNTYLGPDDYYEALTEDLETGWLVLIRPREQMKMEFREYGIDQYVFWSDEWDDLNWRKLKPWQLFQLVDKKIGRLLMPPAD